MFAEVSAALSTHPEKAAALGKTWRKTLERILFFKAGEVQQQQTGPCSFPLPCLCRAAGWLVAMGCCAEPGCQSPAHPEVPSTHDCCRAMPCLWDT